MIVSKVSVLRGKVERKVMGGYIMDLVGVLKELDTRRLWSMQQNWAVLFTIKFLARRLTHCLWLKVSYYYEHRNRLYLQRKLDKFMYTSIIKIK